MLSPNSNLAAAAEWVGEPRRPLLRQVRVVRRAAEAVLRLPAAAGRWLKRRHTGQVLAALDDHQLRDIGLTRAELSKF